MSLIWAILAASPEAARPTRPESKARGWREANQSIVDWRQAEYKVHVLSLHVHSIFTRDNLVVKVKQKSARVYFIYSITDLAASTQFKKHAFKEQFAL